jgi:hypothetical protein
MVATAMAFQSLGKFRFKRRLAPLESGQASIIQHLGNLASADAQQQLATELRDA